MQPAMSAKRGVEDLAEKNRLLLRQCLADGRLLHPTEEGTFNFCDLSQALAFCCGLAPANPTRQEFAQKLAEEIGSTSRKHIVLVLCDGMGVNLLQQHLAPEHFLRAAVDRSSTSLRAVFPATTPAALTTLATATWPGQHGLPGWDLRDQKACEFPKESLHNPIQLTILDSVVRDMRSKKPVRDLGFNTKEIYIDEPWVARGNSLRKMKFINAYNGTDFTEWYQDKHVTDAMNIQETSYETLGMPEGSQQAIQYFNNGIDCVLKSIEEAEENDWQSYIYMYTAHPDKHMHELGIEHPEVTNVLRGISDGLQRLWDQLRTLDATLLVTADHGHVTVEPNEMIALPQRLLDCLEYANVGVHGKGRHAFFHCRSGRQEEFQQAWDSEMSLSSFLLLPINVAIQEGLFGPKAPVPAARPRLGDFLGLSLGASTLVTPSELERFGGSSPTSPGKKQGAHGSLTPAEMRIPWCLWKPGTVA